METMLCPYCECRVLIRDVDDEGGICPECGAVITGAVMMNLSDAFDDDIEDRPTDADEDLLDLDEDLSDDDLDEEEEEF